MQNQGPKIVIIGGGTGTFTVLTALRHYVSNITAIVNMVDDGGSTGILRDEYGVLPPGDIRQCLVALSSSPQKIRDLFNYRFGEGTFEGHSFGNLLLTALEKTTGNFIDAVKTAEEILNIQGRVIPVTSDNVRLCLRNKDGVVVYGEKNVTQTFWDGKTQPNLFLQPKAKLNPEANTAIKKADIIVVGPGNIYSSIVPNLLVDGMNDALINSKAKKVYICNLVTKPGQTNGFMVHDFVNTIEHYISSQIFDFVLYNNKRPEAGLLKKYAKKGEQWVKANNDVLKKAHYQAIGGELVASKIYKQNKNDKLIKRTLIRHDNDKIARLIMKLYLN